MIKKCIKCGSKKIVERIIGIEKIYKILKEVYADFKIKKFTAEEREIDKEIDIFVGTTIIKEILNEFDFGVIIFPHADSFLNFPYYNSEEIFFIILNEFLWKLKKDSRLILQTKNLNLEIFNSLKTKNFNEFYEKELKIRKLLDYPPFSDIIVIEIPVKKSKFFENRVNILKQIIENSGAQILSFDIIDNKKGKQSLKIIFKAGKDKRPDFQKMMGMKEKLDFRIEINPEII
jgi:primosomal protein N' (replication factor Y)